MQQTQQLRSLNYNTELAKTAHRQDKQRLNRHTHIRKQSKQPTQRGTRYIEAIPTI